MTQNTRWGRLFLEATAIVASILAAFAIDAWWDGRQARAEEAELLTGLAQEFEENARQIDEVLRLSRQGRADLQRFLASSPDELGQRAADLSLNSTYEPFIRTWSVAPTVGFLQATINSGKLALIRDVQLRAALARFEGRQSDVLEVLWYTNELNREAAKLFGELEEVQTLLAEAPGEFTAARLGQMRLSAAALVRLRSDPELMSIAAAKLRYWDGYFYEVEALRANVRDVLTLLEQARVR